MALVWPWCGFGVALGWLCTPEYMPSKCLVYGFEVALGGFAWDCGPPSGEPCWAVSRKDKDQFVAVLEGHGVRDSLNHPFAERRMFTVN